MRKDKKWLKEKADRLFFDNSMSNNPYLVAKREAITEISNLIDQLDETELSEELDADTAYLILRGISPLSDKSFDFYWNAINDGVELDEPELNDRENTLKNFITANKKMRKRIDELEEKVKKPTIPQFVADYYNDFKKYELTFAEWFEFPEFGQEGKIADKTFEWLLDNSHEVNIERQFILADIIAHGLDGYEVEEEKKYRVVIKTTDSNLALWQAADGSGDIDFISLDRITTGKRTFTESEIKVIDERYWAFAEEVTE